MKNTLSLTILCATLATLSAHAETTIFTDNFNGALGESNPNSDINIDYANRQAGGELTTTYSKNGNGGAFINTAPGGAFSGETVLLLRTSSTKGSGPSNSGLTTETNFAGSLTEKVYTISFSCLIQTAGKPSTDHWGAFILSDNPKVITPNAKPVDYAILYRERNERNVTIWQDGANSTSTQVDTEGKSPFGADKLFTITIRVDELNHTVDTTINAGMVDEIKLPQTSIDFESTERYFAFRANQGAATGLVDFRYDNFTVTVAP